jgi:integral membrane protein (TIGR01906 family)
MASTVHKISGAIAKWLFILCLPPLLLSSSVAVAVNSNALYQYGFDKYEISQNTGLESAELTKAAQGLIDYFNSDEELISLTVIKDGHPFELFNEREIIHLKDVKDLFKLDYIVLIFTALYILIYLVISLIRRRKEQLLSLARSALTGSGITLSLMTALGIGILIDFDRLFEQFHLLSFSNDFWKLNPHMDYLIMLFPENFWYDTAILCVGLMVAGALLLGLSGWLYLRQQKEGRR